MADKKKHHFFDPATIITMGVVLMWAAAYGRQLYNPALAVPTSLDSLMLMVVSAYITKQTVSHQSKSSDKKEEPDGE